MHDDTLDQCRDCDDHVVVMSKDRAPKALVDIGPYAWWVSTDRGDEEGRVVVEGNLQSQTGNMDDVLQLTDTVYEPPSSLRRIRAERIALTPMTPVLERVSG